MKTGSLSNRLFKLSIGVDETIKCPIITEIKIVPEYTGVGFTPLYGKYSAAACTDERYSISGCKSIGLQYGGKFLTGYGMIGEETIWIKVEPMLITKFLGLLSSHLTIVFLTERGTVR